MHPMDLCKKDYPNVYSFGMIILCYLYESLHPVNIKALYSESKPGERHINVITFVQHFQREPLVI